MIQQDHVGVSVVHTVPRSDTLHDMQDSTWRGIKEFARYMLFGTGLFLAPNPQSLIFARTALLDSDGRTVTNGPADLDAYNPANVPDIEIMLIPYSVSS